MACALAVSAAAIAQNTGTKEEIESSLVRWNLQLDLFDEEIKKQAINPAFLNTIRSQAEAMRAAATGVRKQADAKLKDVRQLLDALGPPPTDKQPAEEASVKQRRIELRDQIATLEGRQKRSELIDARANQILQGISRKLREQRAVELLARGPSPLSWPVIVSAGPHLLHVLRQLAEAPLEEWAPVFAKGNLPREPLGPLLVLIVAFALAWPTRRWLLARYVRDRCVGQPSFARKTVAAIMVAIARGVLPAIITGAPLLRLLFMEQPRGIAADMVVAALAGLTFVLLVSGLARATLAPFSVTGWRMTPFTHKSSRRLYARIVTLSWIAAGLAFIEIPARAHLQIPLNLSIFYDFVTDTAIALGVLCLLPARLWRDRALAPSQSNTAGGGSPFTFGALIRVAIGATALAIPAASLLGYANLSNYLTDNLFLTGIVIGLTFVLHGLTRDVTKLVLERGVERVAAPRDRPDECRVG